MKSNIKKIVEDDNFTSKEKEIKIKKITDDVLMQTHTDGF